MATATAPTTSQTKHTAHDDDDMRAFLMVVRQALLMIVSFIERKYGIQRKP